MTLTGVLLIVALLCLLFGAISVFKFLLAVGILLILGLALSILFGVLATNRNNDRE